MRALVLGLFVLMSPAAIGACALEAGSQISEGDRGELARSLGSSSGSATSTPPAENTATSPGRAEPVVESHKQAAAADKGPTSEPAPTPWRNDGTGGSDSSGKGAQKKDGDLHTKIRDMIEPPDDGKP